MTTRNNTGQTDHQPDAHSGDQLGETHELAGETSSRIGGSPTSPGAAQSWIGKRIGRYEVRALLGTGGMGIVYRAHDSLIERDVAIKILPLEFSANSANLARFMAEAKAAGKLSHPNAVAIYEVGQEGELYYLVMEYVPGGSIADQLDKTGALSVLDATRIAADACRGLAAAHAVGLVHRDIKPANLLRAQDGSVKVADFGLAKLTLDTGRQMTQAGKIVGTPYFMSPEQCQSATIDHRSDIYSLGATYYSMLTGANPYDGEGNIVQVMFAHCNSELLDPRQIDPTIPTACSHIVAQATAKLPDDRYQTANQMLADLNAVSATMTGATDIALPSRSGTFPTQRMSPSDAHPAGTAKTTRRRALAAALSAVATFCLAGGTYAFFRNTDSSRDDAGQIAAGASLPAAVVAPSGPPIRLGVLHSLSGTMAESESPVAEATLLAIEEINHAGGLLGRPVEAVLRDGRSDDAVFAEQAKKLIVDEKVCTVFGCWTSSSRKTVLPIFERHNHLLIYSVQYEGLESSPNIIYLGATPNQQIIPALRWAFAFQNKRRFFLIGSDYVFPRAANVIIRGALAQLGAEVVGEEYLPLGSFDVKATVAKIVEAKPDVILNTINGNSNIPFFKELRRVGVTPRSINTISFSIGEEELRHLNVSEMAGDYAAWSYFQSIDTPQNEQFVARFAPSMVRSAC